jgi:hypothetical protein
MQHEISVEVDDKTYFGRYSVEQGLVTVHYMARQNVTQAGRSPPESIARMLLRELVIAGKS